MALRSRAAFRNAARRRIGRLAQLVERLLYTERVGGSSPSPPTSICDDLRCAEGLDLRCFSRYLPRTFVFAVSVPDSNPIVGKPFEAKAVTPSR